MVEEHEAGFWDRDGAGIRTARLEIRRPHGADARDMAAAANDPRIAANMRETFPSPYTFEDARVWIEFAGAFGWRGLSIAREGRVIGGIGLKPGEDVHRFDAELGYWLGVDYWGVGYASEAVAAFCDQAFARTAFQRLHAVVFDGNPASDRVLEKCGFALEGLARRAIFKHGCFLNCRTYARLKG